MGKKEEKIALKQSFNFDTPWEELLENKKFIKAFLSDVLEDYVLKQRWYGGKANKLKYIELQEYFRIKEPTSLCDVKRIGGASLAFY